MKKVAYFIYAAFFISVAGFAAVDNFTSEYPLYLCVAAAISYFLACAGVLFYGFGISNAVIQKIWKVYACIFLAHFFIEGFLESFQMELKLPIYLATWFVGLVVFAPAMKANFRLGYEKKINLPEKIKKTGEEDSRKNIFLTIKIIAAAATAILLLLGGIVAYEALAIPTSARDVEVVSLEHNNLLSESIEQTKKGDYWEALNFAERALKKAKKLKKFPVYLAESNHQIAFCYQQLKINDKAESFYLESEKYFSVLEGYDLTRKVNFYNSIGTFYYANDNLEKARAFLERAMFLINSTKSIDKSVAAKTFVTLGACYLLEEKDDLAKSVFDRVIAFGPSELVLAQYEAALIGLGNVTKDLKISKKYYQEALEMLEKRDDQDNPDIKKLIQTAKEGVSSADVLAGDAAAFESDFLKKSSVKYSRGKNLYDQGEVDKAISIFEEVVREGAGHTELDPRYQVNPLRSLITAYIQKEDFSKAKPPLESLLKILEGQADTHVSRIIDYFSLKAIVHKGLNEGSQAEEAFLKAQSLFGDGWPNYERDYSLVTLNLANFYLDSERYPEAEVQYLKAIPFLSKLEGSRTELIESYDNLAYSYEMMGKQELADSYYEKVEELSRA